MERRFGESESLNILREIEARLESAAGDVMTHPYGSPARERAEAIYRGASADVRRTLEENLDGWEDPLDRSLYVEGLLRRQRASQEREGRR